jgi:arginyl-tRNA synthetase
MDEFRLHIIEKIIDETGSDGIDEAILEIPPDPKLGDYAFPCFTLAKRLKKSPVQIAEWLKGKILPDDVIEDVKSAGPYLNFFVKKNVLSLKTLKEVFQQKEKYGTGKTGAGKTVVIEFPAPNTNKPLHLGHLRNMALGESMSNILESQGYKIFRLNLNNDRGIHICKSMLAYDRWGAGKTPQSEGKKSDHFVGDYYVMFCQKEKEKPELAQEAQEMLLKWEANDPRIRKLWEKMNAWAFSGFEETYKSFGLPKFDKVYYESATYKNGKEMVLEGLKKGIFTKNKEGAIVVDLSDEGMGEKVLIRADGTSVYITQDLYLAWLKYNDFKYDKSVYIVASEQNHHFKVLFAVLRKLGLQFVEGCYHFSYGMVLLPEGKMKSREGTVVDADDLMLEMEDLAKEEVVKRFKDLEEQQVHDRAKAIGLGALKFYLLMTDPVKDITFHPEQSISFEGETGPYVQYAHARICSILRKYGKKISTLPNVKYERLSEEIEKELLKRIYCFKEIVAEAAEQYKPSIVAKYLIELGQTFNTFYTQCPVIKTGDDELTEARIMLCAAVKQVLNNGLRMLGMAAPEEM